MVDSRKAVIRRFAEAQFEELTREYVELGVPPLKLRPQLLQQILVEVKGWMCVIAPEGELDVALEVFADVLNRPLAKVARAGLKV